MKIMEWLFAGTRRARAELLNSQADIAHVARLGADLRRIDRENHISQRVHDAARGLPDSERR